MFKVIFCMINACLVLSSSPSLSGKSKWPSLSYVEQWIHTPLKEAFTMHAQSTTSPLYLINGVMLLGSMSDDMKQGRFFSAQTWLKMALLAARLHSDADCNYFSNCLSHKSFFVFFFYIWLQGRFQLSSASLKKSVRRAFSK